MLLKRQEWPIISSSCILQQQETLAYLLPTNSISFYWHKEWTLLAFALGIFGLIEATGYVPNESLKQHHQNGSALPITTRFLKMMYEATVAILKSEQLAAVAKTWLLLELHNKSLLNCSCITFPLALQSFTQSTLLLTIYSALPTPCNNFLCQNEK